ncbi:MAG TPA: HAMP domain-containing sensor histidine kinase [Candidatus Dormibacteraeota bacterium]|nr:HAMP domain-containing sensor histidine kinase [Candidatus Dormibacteraeota bacterium]
MTFRLRVTLLAALAVAVTAIAAAGLIYAMVQHQLLNEIDDSLVQSANSARQGSSADRRFPGRSAVLYLSGRYDMFAQIVDTSGRIVPSEGQPGSPELVDTVIRDVANGAPATFTDIHTSDTHWRVYAMPLGQGRALEIARPVAEIDAAFFNTRPALLALALGAALLAAILGALIAQAALAPVRRLSATVAEVTRTRDLSRRVGMTGSDEIAHLASSFDAMLTALEVSLRSQRQLVADASHELRTPLTSLRTNLELLARGQPTDPAERQQVLRDLVSQIERLSTLVADLIDLARDEEAHLPIEDVRLDEVVATAIDEMKARYPHVRFALVAEPSSVRGVHSRIARAVTNLLDNASKWSPAGGVVEVSVSNGEVSVRDHGPGVAPEDRPRVFDRFWRASTAHHLPGSGLGLSIVKQVAEAHGGTVTLEHPADGGARFRLRLGGASSAA